MGGDDAANVNAALGWVRTVFFKASNGDRSTVQNVVVLFVVGKVTADGDSGTSAAAILKNPPTSAKILTIGIDADESEMEAIASDPDDEVRNVVPLPPSHPLFFSSPLNTRRKWYKEALPAITC